VGSTRKAPKFIDPSGKIYCICLQHFNRMTSITLTFQFCNPLVKVAQFLLQCLNPLPNGKMRNGIFSSAVALHSGRPAAHFHASLRIMSADTLFRFGRPPIRTAAGYRFMPNEVAHFCRRTRPRKNLDRAPGAPRLDRRIQSCKNGFGWC
jgi:hypothetical protein